jgi:hypothetical protein
MTAAAESSFGDVLTSLWRRAPPWRAALIAAVASSLLFMLFPPATTSSVDIPLQDVGVPSYAPPAVAQVADQRPPVTQAVAPTQTPHAKAVKARQALSSSQPAPPQRGSPTTASLSLAMPSGAAGNNAAAQTGLNPGLYGRTYSGSIQVNGFQLPLPAGNWVMLANQGINFPTASGTDYFFGRIKDKHLVGAILVYTLRPKSPSDTVMSSLVKMAGCNRADALYMSSTEMADGGFPSCWFTHGWFSSPMLTWADRASHLESVLRATGGDLAAKGVDYPQDFVAVQFVRNQTWGLLYAEYLFSPQAEGIQSNIVSTYLDSDWTHDHIGRFPEKVAYAEKIKAWGMTFWPKFESAFAAGKPP